MEKIVYEKIDEIVYKTTLKNKMNVHLLYKKDFVEKTAYIVTKFGHFDSVRKIVVDGKKKKIPWGAAHFLEHRMFSLNDKDATEKITQLASSFKQIPLMKHSVSGTYAACAEEFY